MRLRVCKNPKHLAWATWTILANNPVNKQFYILLQIIEGAIQYFYLLVILSRMHYQNLESGSVSKEQLANSKADTVNNHIQDQYDGPGISYKQIRSADLYLIEYTTSKYNMLWFSATIAILSVSLFILITILLLAIFIKNHVGLQKPDYLKKGLCFLMILFMTILQMPILDAILRTIMTISGTSDSLSLIIVKYGVSFLALLFFCILMLYLILLFNVCIPTEQVPWCYPVSKIVFLNIGAKIIIVGCVVFDQEGQYALIEVICLLVIQTILGGQRLLFSPNYQLDVDFIVKTRDFSNLLALVIGISCKMVADEQNYDIIYMICFSPIVTLGWKILETMRNQQILSKLKSKSLKLEVEYEYILYTLMMLIQTTNSDSLADQKVFGQLMDIMIVHINECDDQLCICEELENFYELMKFKFINNSEVFSLARDERKKYKKIIDDQGLVGTISNITDLIVKTHSTESTILKANNELDRQSKMEEAELLERQTLANQENMNINGQSIHKKKKSKQAYKINIDQTKH